MALANNYFYTQVIGLLKKRKDGFVFIFFIDFVAVVDVDDDGELRA